MSDRLERSRTAVLQRVDGACRAAGRSPDEVRVVGVTKSVAPPVAAALFALGTRDLGESRAPELERKARWFAERGLQPRWHFIGHLQQNKARRVLRLADEIHSVDSVRLLERLARIAEEEERRPGIYLQVKLSDEAEKTGFAPDAVPAATAQARATSLPLLGLMGMAPLVEGSDAERARRARAAFGRLAELARTLPAEAFAHGAPRLSMGMTGDFEEAIHAGAHVLRIGSAFFADAVPSTEATP